jgi:micrococcal nuclease
LRKILSVLFALALVLSMTTPVFAFEDKDCSDFSTWEEAQRFFEENGGPAQDPHRLDGNDKDGLVCESLPGFNPNHVPGSFVDNEPPTQQPPSPSKMTATVVDVVDGDTIKVKLSNGDQETVRFLLIDTPETVHPSKPVQPCGPEASAFTKKMLPAGKTVELELDVQERDRYGRLLAYVYVDGKSVQKALLAEGLAKVAVYPPNVKYVDQYRAIEADAKEQKKGIWSDNPCSDKDDGSNNSGKDGTKPDDDQKDDGNKGTDDNKQDNMIEQPKSGNSGGQTGGKLPKTATSYPTNALLGAGILAAGLGLLLIRRRAV